MGKQNVKAAYPKDNLEFKPSSNIFAMSWQSQLSNAHYSSLLMGWKAARGQEDMLVAMEMPNQGCQKVLK